MLPRHTPMDDVCRNSYKANEHHNRLGRYSLQQSVAIYASLHIAGMTLAKLALLTSEASAGQRMPTVGGHQMEVAAMVAMAVVCTMYIYWG